MIVSRLRAIPLMNIGQSGMNNGPFGFINILENLLALNHVDNTV